MTVHPRGATQKKIRGVRLPACTTHLLPVSTMDADDDSLLCVLQAVDVTETGLRCLLCLAQTSRAFRLPVRALLSDGGFMQILHTHRRFKRDMKELLDLPSTVTDRVLFMRSVDADGKSNIGRILRHARLYHEDAGAQYGICKLLWTSFFPQACKTDTIHQETCETAGREGAIDVLLQMLKIHPHEVKLHVTVCWALSFLVQCAETNRTLFLQTDGLERLLALEHQSCRSDILASEIAVDNSRLAMHPDVITECLTRRSLCRGIQMVCNTLTSQTRSRDDTILYHSSEAERVAAARAECFSTER